MDSLMINTLRRSTNLALTAAVALASVLFAARAGHTQQLQQGVSVQLAVTSTAAPMPEADNEDAWIVAVTPDGSVFFGIDKVSPEGLADKMKSRPRRRDQKLYIKADARAPFASVESVLEAARVDLFEAPVLLTSQPESTTPGTIVPPMGLEVLVHAPSSTESVVVQLFNSGQPSPTLKVNNADVPKDAVQNTLKQLLQTRSEKVVVVKAAGMVPFADVVRVIDACRLTGAKVVLVTSGL